MGDPRSKYKRAKRRAHERVEREIREQIEEGKFAAVKEYEDALRTDRLVWKYLDYRDVN